MTRKREDRCRKCGRKVKSTVLAGMTPCECGYRFPVNAPDLRPLAGSETLSGRPVILPSGPEPGEVMTRIWGEMNERVGK